MTSDGAPAVPTSKVKELAAMFNAVHAQEDRAAARQNAEQVAAKLREMKLADAAALLIVLPDVAQIAPELSGRADELGHAIERAIGAQQEEKKRREEWLRNDREQKIAKCPTAPVMLSILQRPSQAQATDAPAREVSEGFRSAVLDTGALLSSSLDGALNANLKSVTNLLDEYTTFPSLQLYGNVRPSVAPDSGRTCPRTSFRSRDNFLLLSHVARAPPA